ncbi:hypothetical protein N566_06775 [Streptomycetaceae bacterium MP113-05]|nr:hypothetical protein N566_06775 [Streptomycetaceae bacterium MP113-05]
MRVDLSAAEWRRSSYSNESGGNCVEVSPGFPGLVPVRDSKDPEQPALCFSDTTWQAFVSSL